MSRWIGPTASGRIHDRRLDRDTASVASAPTPSVTAHPLPANEATACMRRRRRRKGSDGAQLPDYFALRGDRAAPGVHRHPEHHGDLLLADELEPVLIRQRVRRLGQLPLRLLDRTGRCAMRSRTQCSSPCLTIVTKTVIGLMLALLVSRGIRTILDVPSRRHLSAGGAANDRRRDRLQVDPQSVDRNLEPVPRPSSASTS